MSVSQAGIYIHYSRVIFVIHNLGASIKLRHEVTQCSGLGSKNILFITVASNEIGFGHLNRCLALASYASSCGAKVKFLVFGSKTAQTKVEQLKYSCTLLSMKLLNYWNRPTIIKKMLVL